MTKNASSPRAWSLLGLDVALPSAVFRLLAIGSLSTKTHWSDTKFCSKCIILSWWYLYSASLLRICVLALGYNVVIFHCRLWNRHHGSVSTQLMVVKPLGFNTVVGPGGGRSSTKVKEKFLMDSCICILYVYVKSCLYLSQSFWLLATCCCVQMTIIQLWC